LKITSALGLTCNTKAEIDFAYIHVGHKHLRNSCVNNRN